MELCASRKLIKLKAQLPFFKVDEAGSLTNLCTTVKNLPDNVYPTTSALEDQFIYLNGYPESVPSPVESLFVLDITSCTATSLAWAIQNSISVSQLAVL